MKPGRFALVETEVKATPAGARRWATAGSGSRNRTPIDQSRQPAVSADTPPAPLRTLARSLHDREDWKHYFVLRQTFDTVQIYERSATTTVPTGEMETTRLVPVELDMALDHRLRGGIIHVTDRSLMFFLLTEHDFHDRAFITATGTLDRPAERSGVTTSLTGRLGLRSRSVLTRSRRLERTRSPNGQLGRSAGNAWIT